MRIEEQLQRRIGELEAELTSERNRSAALSEQLAKAVSAKDRIDWAAGLKKRPRLIKRLNA